MTNSSNVQDESCAEGYQPSSVFYFFARLVLCTSIASIFYAFWTLNLPAAIGWKIRMLRIAPRVAIFALGLLSMQIIQGAKPGKRALLVSGLAAAALSIWLLQFSDLFQLTAILHDKHTAEESLGLKMSGTPAFLTTAAVIPLLRFEAALFAAILLGAWLGRGVNHGGQFVTLVLCAAVGDIWLSAFRVPESVAPAEIISLLRLPWPPALGRLSPTPAFTDLLFSCAILSSAARLRLSVPAVFAAALTGYLCASFLALGPWPGWPGLSMLLCGSGVLLAAWPDLRCGMRDAGKAFLISAVLLAVLMGFSSLHRKFRPMPEAPAPPLHDGSEA